MHQSIHITAREHGRGFTLIELLVSLSLFSVVMLICIGTLLSIVDANRKAQSVRAVVDNVQFALESMARNIRVGTEYECEGGGNCTGGSSLRFRDDQDNLVTYSHTGDHIERTTGGATAELTAPEAIIDEMKFFVTGVGSGDDEQPTVTIVVKAHTEADPETDTEFTVQTTVVQRTLEF